MKKYQYEYSYKSKIKGVKNVHCMTLFDTHDQAERALRDRLSDLEEAGVLVIGGDVLLVDVNGGEEE